MKNSWKELFQLLLMYEMMKLCCPLAREAFSLSLPVSLWHLLTERPYAVIHIWDPWNVVCFSGMYGMLYAVLQNYCTV